MKTRLHVGVKGPELKVRSGRCDAGLECSLQATAQNSNGQTNQPWPVAPGIDTVLDTIIRFIEWIQTA